MWESRRGFVTERRVPGPIERARRPVTTFVIGVALAIVFALTDQFSGRPVRLDLLFVFGQGTAWIWWFVAPAAQGLSRRLPLEGSRRWERALGHFVASLAVAALVVAMLTPLNHWFITRWTGEAPTLAVAFRTAGTYLLFPNVVLYWLVLTAEHAAIQTERLRDREVQLARAQMDVLAMQMSPHFLFNALHSVSALASSDDPKRASDLVARIGNALRESMTLRDEPTGTLRAELEVLDDYVEIERVRFGDRIAIEVIAPEETLDVELPRWSLQPLVENALLHGLSERVEGGRVTVTARLVDGVLEVEVADDGVGLGDEVREGVGLGNTRARLRALYDERASLTLEDRDGGGAVATLRVPVEGPS